MLCFTSCGNSFHLTGCDNDEGVGFPVGRSIDLGGNQQCLTPMVVQYESELVLGCDYFNLPMAGLGFLWA